MPTITDDLPRTTVTAPRSHTAALVPRVRSCATRHPEGVETIVRVS